MNKDVYSTLKSKEKISILDQQYKVVGFKESDNPERELSKILLKRNGKDYWLEFQFYEPYRIILWKQILDTFEPNNTITYQDNKFILQDKGFTTVKDVGGTGTKYKQEIVDWWDYQYNNYMISLGWMRNAKKWENLFGRLINEKDIFYLS